MALKAGSTERKPTIACVGYVDSIGELKAGQNGSKYYTIPVNIKNQGSGLDIKVNLSFLPEMFANDFDVDKVTERTHGPKWRGVKWSYEKNFIANKPAVTAMLQCITGDEENFGALCSMIDNLPDLDPETIYDHLTDFLRDLGSVGFGYILRQPNKKTDEVDPETSKAIYEISPYYEVDAFFRLSETNVKALVKRAAKNKLRRTDDPTVEKFQLRFDPTQFNVSADED